MRMACAHILFYFFLHPGRVWVASLWHRYFGGCGLKSLGTLGLLHRFVLVCVCVYVCVCVGGFSGAGHAGRPGDGQSGLCEAAHRERGQPASLPHHPTAGGALQHSNSLIYSLTH